MPTKNKGITSTSEQIVCVHTHDDFGGTSLIISEIIEGLLEKGYHIELYSAKSKHKGFLSTFTNIKRYNYHYRRSNNSFLLVIYLFVSQFLLFFKLLRYYNKDVIFYINTLMPWGAAIAARIMRKRVVFHVHEISTKPLFVKMWCKWVAKHTAHDLIYVSEFVKIKKLIDAPRRFVVHNALSPRFVRNTIPNYHRDEFIVLMLCNLKIYKGVIEFVQIARLLPQYSFELVLNATDDEINSFFKNIRFSENLAVHGSQPSVHRFYARASVVLNLSHPDKWLESFGMTALEAMNYGLPVIVPPRGGISELVVDGYNGYHLSYTDLDKIVATIIKIAENPDLYLELSNGAREMVEKFSYTDMIENIESILKTGKLKGKALESII